MLLVDVNLLVYAVLRTRHGTRPRVSGLTRL